MKAGEENIDFVARHYRQGAFDVRESLKKIKGGMERRRIYVRAAAVAAVLLVAAGASALWYKLSERAQEPEDIVAAEVTTTAGPETVRVIDLQDAPLAEVVDSVESIYGVKVGGTGTDADSVRLTLRYEGTAAEIIELINDDFDLKLYIEE